MPLPTPKELKAALSAATKETSERRTEASAAEAVYHAAFRLAHESDEKARVIETAAKVIGWPDKERGEFLGATFDPNKAPDWAVRRSAALRGQYPNYRNSWHERFIAARAYLLSLMETP